MRVRAERQNDDYDTEDPASTAVKRTVVPVEDSRSNRPVKSPKPVKPKTAVVPAKPRSVTFRPAGDDIKDMVITNAMVSARPTATTTEKVNKYGINAINERALGKVVNRYITGC